MKGLRYPLLFLAIILVPTSLAMLFVEISNLLQIEPEIWSLILSLAGYLLGYVSIYFFTKTINHSFHEEVYSKRMQTSYLVTSAIVGILLLAMLRSSIAILYAEQPLTQTAYIIFIGLPWISIQMLVLLFFVRSESLFR